MQTSNEKDVKPIRTVSVKPIDSTSMFSVLPIEDLFTGLVQGDSSIMFFVGRILSYWGYTKPTDIGIYVVDLNNFQWGEFTEESGILQKTILAIKTLHFRNRHNKEEQLKDFGRIIWLLEEHLRRTDHFCPKCSGLIPLRFPDIFEFCGKCGTKLEVKEYMPLRFRKRSKTRRLTS